MTNKITQSEINAILWQACDTFRGVIDPSEYKNYILVMLFVNYIINHLTQNGSLDPGLLYDRPFTDIHYGGPEGVFDDEQADELVAIMVRVNESVGM